MGINLGKMWSAVPREFSAAQTPRRHGDRRHHVALLPIARREDFAVGRRARHAHGARPLRRRLERCLHRNDGAPERGHVPLRRLCRARAGRIRSSQQLLRRGARHCRRSSRRLHHQGSCMPRRPPPERACRGAFKRRRVSLRPGPLPLAAAPDPPHPFLGPVMACAQPLVPGHFPVAVVAVEMAVV